MQFAHYHQFLFPKIVVSQPLADALTVFTDGSSNGIASLIVQGNTATWRTNCKSAQEVELFAVFRLYYKSLLHLIYIQTVNIS